METKKRALGRGLEQLFNSENLDLEQLEKKIYETSTNEEVIEININDLRVNPYQPRKHFDETALSELSLSIKEHGVIQPIIVKKSIKGYEIIAGERRTRASKIAGLDKIPAIVREFSDEQMMEIALLENLQRENLSSIEEAYAYKAMIDKLYMTQEELSKKVGKSRSHVTNILGLLHLPQEIQELVNTSKISMGHARILSKLDDTKKIYELADKIVNDKISVREIEKMTDSEEIQKRVKINKRENNNEYKHVEELLKEKLDTKVKINDKRIEISYTNIADLNRILEIIDIKE
ncbi:MAG: ParB/RepB/Spo0J family partition protein [Bacilli bacterium]